jgi:hypothetical protein
MERRDPLSSWRACLPLVVSMMFLADAASAAVWQWGCMGRLGEDQIVFNRDRLVLISGKAPAGKLDDFVRSGDFPVDAKHPASPREAIATYQPDNGNDGLSATMTFSGDGTQKLTLTELSSKKIGHNGRLVAGCRDETIDRFRKSYRVERDQEPARTVTLVCMEYQLSTKGGRTCG